MNRYTFRHKGETLTRVTLAQARKLWEAGEIIGLCPIKLSPVAFERAFLCLVSNETGSTFEDVVSSFRVYNCGSNETGYAVSFWKLAKEASNDR